MADETALQKAEREKLEAETAQIGSEAGKVAAETKKAGAEAEKAVTDATVPAPVTVSGAPEGKTTNENTDGMLGRMVAYRLLGDAAVEMADAIVANDADGKNRILLVEDRNLLATDWPYQVVGAQLGAEKDALEKARTLVSALTGPSAPPPSQPDTTTGDVQTTIAPMVVAGIGAAVISSATSLVGLLRSDYTITGGEAKIGTTPLLAATADALRERGHEVIVDGFELLEGELVGDFMAARTTRIALEGEIAAKRTQYGGAELASGTTAPPGSEAGRQTLAAAEVKVKAFDAFTTAVTASAEKGSAPLLVTAARRERLHLPADDDRAVSHVLFVAVEGGGQETITKHSGFRGGNKKASFLGGAQVSYLLHDVATKATVAAGSRQLVGQVEFDLGETSAKPLERIAIEPPAGG